MSRPDDLAIARAAVLRPIAQVAADLGLSETQWDPYGRTKAKVRLDAVDGQRVTASRARTVVVTAMTPTRSGEGKTVTTVGLAQGLAALGEPTIATLRQPSQGPTFGLKGGAAGGGYAQVVPMEDVNLHLTGDIHAVGAAHNLLAAAVDSRIYHESRYSDRRLDKAGLRRLDIQPDTVSFRRVVDVDDRALRHIHLNANGTDGVERDSGFDITAASEVMAILALATDLADLRCRLGAIVVGFDGAGQPITAEQVGAAGAMAALLSDAIHPTLLQTLEGSAVLMHAGPFANIAHGNSSIIADRLALGLLSDGGYLVTECGFGSDCGFEKYSHIKCRSGSLRPDVAVVVATVKALREHGADADDPLAAGMENLAAHIDVVRAFGVPAVVAVNRFPDDDEADIQTVLSAAIDLGATEAAVSDVWARGGQGGAELAQAVQRACTAPNSFRYLYELDQSPAVKMNAIATGVYGAEGIELSDQAQARLDQFDRLGFSGLPVIMAKTPASLSHDPKRKGRPTGFTVPVRDVRLAAGAGFLYALCGDIMTMPGLPLKPAFLGIDVDAEGRVSGLS